MQARRHGHAPILRSLHDCQMKMPTNEGRNVNRPIRTRDRLGYHSNADEVVKVFWNMTSHRFVNSYWLFGVVCCFHPQSRRIQEAPQNLHQNQTEATWLLLAEDDRLHMFCNPSIRYVTRTGLSLHNLHVQCRLSVMRFQIRWHYQYGCYCSRYRDWICTDTKHFKTESGGWTDGYLSIMSVTKIIDYVQCRWWTNGVRVESTGTVRRKTKLFRLTRVTWSVI